MRLRISFLSALLLAALGAFVSPQKAKAGEIRKGLAFTSKALRGDMTFSLYLPDAYAADPARKFPVLYLLHGYGGNDREWLELGRVNEVLDRMIANGEIPPVIAVMPYGARGWYVDSAALGGPGNYESAIAIDLIDHVDRAYRTVSDRAARAVAGLSMGGYGATRMAFFHPDRFVGVVSLSGALHQTENIPATEQPLLLANLNQRAERKYHGAYGTPFDMKVFAARNPFTRIPDLSRIQNPPKVLIMTGDDDVLNFYEGSCQLFVALRRAKLQAELRVDDGGHDWSLWRVQLPDMLRFLTNAMKERPVGDAAVVASGATAPTAPGNVQPVTASPVAVLPAAAMLASPAGSSQPTGPTPTPQPAAMQPAATAQAPATVPAAKRAEARPAQIPAEKPRPIATEPISLKPAVELPPAPAQPPAARAASTSPAIGR
jgi:S-formylglutathione hydrolase FrmB